MLWWTRWSCQCIPSPLHLQLFFGQNISEYLQRGFARWHWTVLSEHSMQCWIVSWNIEWPTGWVIYQHSVLPLMLWCIFRYESISSICQTDSVSGSVSNTFRFSLGLALDGVCRWDGQFEDVICFLQAVTKSNYADKMQRSGKDAIFFVLDKMQWVLFPFKMQQSPAPEKIQQNIVDAAKSFLATLEALHFTPVSEWVSDS